MQHFRKLDNLLKNIASENLYPADMPDVYSYARCMADIEGVVAVVTDLTCTTSRIFSGAFARVLGLEDYHEENSIWEKKILSLMPQAEQQEKFMAELRFFHNIRQMPGCRRHCCLMTRLRMTATNGETINVLHRMHYVFEPGSDRIRYAICLYGPLAMDLPARSLMVNTLTGATEQLTDSGDAKILSPRERQVLSLIDSGLTSEGIAERLCISRHTVSRHRQEILSKLQVRNSIEACRIAKSMKLI